MTILLEIPDSVARAIRLPPAELHRRLKVELTLSLYAQDFLSFGKARELAGMTELEFGLLLGRRNIARHYEQDDLQDDLAYGGGQ
jgi:predicted HTH domain antitoxin